MASVIARRLTAPQRKFVHLHFIEGAPLARAYAEAFAKYRTVDPREGYDKYLCTKQAKRLILRTDIQAYANEVREEAAELDARARFLSLEEKRRFLADVVRATPAMLDEDSSIVQEWIGTFGKSTRAKIPDKLRALEIDAKLAGELKTDIQVEVSERILDFAESLV